MIPSASHGNSAADAITMKPQAIRHAAKHFRQIAVPDLTNVYLINTDMDCPLFADNDRLFFYV
jgi:hypothetical protein